MPTADELPCDAVNWPTQQQFNRMVAEVLQGIRDDLDTLIADLDTDEAALASAVSDQGDLQTTIDGCCA